MEAYRLDEYHKTSGNLIGYYSTLEDALFDTDYRVFMGNFGNDDIDYAQITHFEFSDELKDEDTTTIWGEGTILETYYFKK